MRSVLTVAALLVTCGLVSAQPQGATQSREPPGAALAELTRAFATFDATDIDGRRWSAATLKGRVVVMDFWATWCGPCLAEIPWIRKARDRFSSDRLVILGVNLDVGERRTLLTWLNRQRIDWPQIRDGQGYSGDLARRFGVTSLPNVLVVNSSGVVVRSGVRGDRILTAVSAALDPNPGSRQP